MRRLHGACRRRRGALLRAAGERRRGKAITTIEGLAPNGVLHRVQQAWVDHDVPQCGYCQSGMIMAVAALLKQKPNPTDAEIDAAITNICRCGTYQRVRAAIHAAANAMTGLPMDIAMSAARRIDRRTFLVSVAAAGGALALGFEVPFGPRPRAARRRRAGDHRLDRDRSPTTP